MEKQRVNKIKCTTVLYGVGWLY